MVLKEIKKQVFDLLTNIPKGKVVSYGQLGSAVGLNPRLIGRIIHENEDTNKYPCHRVVKADGSLASGYAFGGPEAQKSKLIAEGIKFTNNKVSSVYFLNNL